MSAAIIPLLRTLGPRAIKTLGPLVINRIHNLAVRQLNKKVNSVTPGTNVSGLQNQIRTVMNTRGMSNNNKRKLMNLSIQLRRNKRQ